MTLPRILITSLLILLSTPNYAEELTPEKIKSIDVLLEKTGAAKISQMLSSIYIKRANASLKQQDPNIDPKAFAIVSEEVNKVFAEEVNKKNPINTLIHPIYHKHLTLAELDGIISFYETALGKKVLSVMPLITRDARQASFAWGKSLRPQLSKKLQARFEEEGIKFKFK